MRLVRALALMMGVTIGWLCRWILFYRLEGETSRRIVSGRGLVNLTCWRFCWAVVGKGKGKDKEMDIKGSIRRLE
jgi:hypothetical protein